MLNRENPQRATPKANRCSVDLSPSREDGWRSEEEQRKSHCTSAVLDHKVSEALTKPPGMVGSLTSVSSVAQDGEQTLEEAAIPTTREVGADNPQESAL